MRLTVAVLLAGIIAGCGSDDPAMTEADRIKIGQAGTTIIENCRGLDSYQDLVAIQDAVTDLLDARDTFGDQKFTLPGGVEKYTVQQIIDTEIREMRETDCVPDQRERLE